MMIKHIRIFSYLSLLIGNVTFSQIGINTNTPKAALDIQGDIRIKDKIYLGGDDSNIGKLGGVGSVLVSQGASKASTWKVLRRPEFKPNTYYLINYEAANSQTDGLSLAHNATAYNNKYSKDTKIADFLAIGGSGGELTKLKKTFKINNSLNKTALIFETIAQINTSVAGDQFKGADFACGIFVDDLLKGVRVYTLNQPTTSVGPFYTYTLVTSVENLPVGNHDVRVACKRRSSISSFGDVLGIGKSVRSNINDFMAESTLRVEVFEIPDPTNTESIFK